MPALRAHRLYTSLVGVIVQAVQVPGKTKKTPVSTTCSDVQWLSFALSPAAICLLRQADRAVVCDCLGRACPMEHTRIKDSFDIKQTGPSLFTHTKLKKQIVYCKNAGTLEPNACGTKLSATSRSLLKQLSLKGSSSSKIASHGWQGCAQANSTRTDLRR